MAKDTPIPDTVLHYRGQNHRERRIRQAEQMKKEKKLAVLRAEKKKKAEELEAKAKAPAFDSFHSKSEWLNGLRMRMNKTKR